MYNQGNMRLHVDLFIKYVSNNVYSDTNHGQPQSILNIFLTFFSSLYFMTTFCGLFSVWYWYHCFFCWAGWKWMGRRDCLTNFYFFFHLVGSPKVGGAGHGKHKKNTATLIQLLEDDIEQRPNEGLRIFKWLHLINGSTYDIGHFQGLIWTFVIFGLIFQKQCMLGLIFLWNTYMKSHILSKARPF